MRIASGKSGFTGEDTAAGIAVRVMDITQKFIGALDMLELGIHDVDQVQPAIIEIKTALAGYPNLSSSEECIKRVEKWVTKLQSKEATDTLDAENEVKALKLDLEMA